ncbi:hypothetical protein J2W27_004523 [Variovorax boronicumulans]|uniref:hypothetical protein n=1 Tax=Variovorax boronicumulans TaxID=436515 RepID=UPI0027858E98|nr:hypothetical protein [Variovorax boronicumulans]MDP9912397.1 hypothetical protein [Variovorax boronicumulans]
MKKMRSLVVGLLLPGWLYAQVPYGLSVDHSKVQARQPVKVTVNFEAASRWCGLRIDLGDGDVRDILVDSFPVTLSKQYNASGRYVLRAEGRFLLRGLTSALGCDGKARTVTVSVGELPRDASNTSSDEVAKDELERRKRNPELERERSKRAAQLERERDRRQAELEPEHKPERKEVRESPGPKASRGGVPAATQAPTAPTPPRDGTLKVF